MVPSCRKHLYIIYVHAIFVFSILILSTTPVQESSARPPNAKFVLLVLMNLSMWYCNDRMKGSGTCSLGDECEGCTANAPTSWCLHSTNYAFFSPRSTLRDSSSGDGVAYVGRSRDRDSATE